MAENLGTDVSFVSDSEGYAYDTVVFQKGKPPLDTELNEAQTIRRLLSERQMENLPSGWLTLRPTYTSPLLSNQFYTQNPSTAIPEYALVNGMVIYVTNTKTSEDNSNIVDLGDPPLTGNVVNGVFLEVWRALLDPDTSTNRPDPETVIDSLMAIYAADQNNAWTVGENGLILRTENGGQSWNIQLIDTKKKLNSVFFINSTIGWAVGDDGIIGRTTSGGERWNVIQSGYTEDLNSIHAVSQLVAWIAGDTGLLLKTTNGVNWVSMTTGVTVNLNSVHFYDELVGWAVGDSGTILRSTDGGSTWLPMTSGTTENLNNVHFYDLNFGFAVGANGTILRSSDGGLSWVNQSGNVYDGSYKSLSVDYTDVTMMPNLDQYEDGEEVSSQFTGSNKNCTTLNVPVTRGDGLGTTTNNPADITVTVEGVEVLVDSLDGATGQVILHEAPRATDEVKIYYYFRVCGEIFRGSAWITGKSGTILRTTDIGAKWIEQDPDTAYDLNGVTFVDQAIGWLAGNFSVIRYTENGGDTWTEQKSDVIARQIQRVFYEGNVDTVIYLNDESLHPDPNIETTKRVQIQYRIRVIDGADPFNYPEAGLGSSAVVGLGPNDSGSFAFENMGATTGDYGLWRARCSNTVDGYCYAIPMYFVNRRNSAAYNAETNSNGSNQKGTANIRPDLLVGTDIVDADILDIRRLINIPSVSELLDRNFDSLMNNNLRTRFFRDTLGGDRYGTEILQLDRVGGGTGGQEISGVALTDVVDGNISSNVTLETVIEVDTNPPSPPDPPPAEHTFSALTDGVYHPNSAYYSAFYESSNPVYNNKPIPGYFTDLGTNQVTFVFSTNANTKGEDPSLTKYKFTATKIIVSSTGLNKVPSAPQLVKNYDGGTDPAFFYQGVFQSSVTGRIIEQWDSGVPGYTSYTMAYPGSDSVITEQSVRASTVEVHAYKRITSADLDGPNKLLLTNTITPDPDDVSYSIQTISKINNITSGFSYKIADIIIDDPNITVESVSGFPFVEGTVIEIISMALSQTGDSNIRNGASVNFVPGQKKIDTFCKSEIVNVGSVSDTDTYIEMTISGGIAFGVSATETEQSLTQHFCWITPTAGTIANLYPVQVTNLGTATVTLTFIDSDGNPTQIGIAGDVTIQVLIVQSSLLYEIDSEGDGLHIGYNYIPFQSVSGLPSSTTFRPVIDPKTLYISNIGLGGSLYDKSPYDFPLLHIPTNDPVIASDNEFYNVDLLRFPDFSIDNGFVQMPVYLPGSFGEDLTFSELETDYAARTYYSVSSKEFTFTTEGIKIGNMRKIFMPVLCRVKETSDNRLLRGEYVLIIVSRNALMDLDNYTGYEIDGKSVLAIYRLPNKPLAKV